MKIHQDEVEPSGPESELDIKSEAHQRAIKAIKEGKGEDAKNKIKTLETSVREKIEKKKKEIELERKRRNLERESSERSKAGRE